MSFEPAVKRMKIAKNRNSLLVFGSNPDRKLLIKDTIFHVQSDILIEHCGYFRSLFTSDFKEKEQEVIPIKVFNAEQMIMFMCALYETDGFNITGRNLEAAFEMFNYFEAVTFLIKLLAENNVFERFPEKLLDLSAHFGLIELTKLIDHRLASHYHSSSHQPETENKYVRLMRKYKLEHLKAEIVEYATKYFKLHRFEYEIICRRYINSEDPEEMKLLKDKIEGFLLDSFETYGTCNIEQCGEYLETSTTYKMNKLTNRIEQFLQSNNIGRSWLSLYLRMQGIFGDKYLLQVGQSYGFQCINDLSDSWKTIKQYYFSEETEKEKLEKFIIGDVGLLLKAHEQHQDSIIKDLLYFTKGSAKLKEIIQTFAIKRFDGQKNVGGLQYYTTNLEQCKEYKLDKLEACIHVFLFSEYKTRPDKDRRCTLNDDEVTKLAFVFHINDLTNYIENSHVTYFKSNMERFDIFAELLMSYEMPVLKNCVENFLLDKLEAGDFDPNFIEKCCKYAYYCRMEQLKEKLDNYLVTDFEATRNFRHIQFAFLNNPFVKYSNAVQDVLSSSHISDPFIKAAHKYITDLRIEDQNTIFKTLRKVVHYEEE